MLVPGLARRLWRRLRNTVRFWAWPVVTIEGVRVRVDRRFSPIIVESLFAGWYERPEMRLLASCLVTSDVVMELGTGLGVVAAFCAKRVGSARVFTYEANPELQPHIAETARLNRVTPHVEMCILGDRSGTAPFYLADGFWESSTLPAPCAREVKVPMRSFNEEVRRHRPTCLIVDIEGGEYELVQYADLRTVRTLLIELHADILGTFQANVVLELLGKAGFEAQERTGKLYLFRRPEEKTRTG